MTKPSQRIQKRLLGIAIVVLVTTCAFVGLRVYWHSYIPSQREAARRATCQNNLKHLVLVVWMYAKDHGGLAPALAQTPGQLALRDTETYREVFPHYFTDPAVLQCPSEGTHFQKEVPPPLDVDYPTVADDRCYFYLGYAINNQQELEDFARAYRAEAGTEGAFDGELRIRDDDGIAITFPRLQPMNDDAASTPVFIERYPNGHIPRGGSVVYADGHVKWIAFGRKWPMTEEAMAVLMELDAMGARAAHATL